ncbi:MAG: Rpn family recombination-promoting nuclease/putative transposase, partial [Brevinematia bacterium]
FLLYLFNATDVEPEKVGLILKSVEKEGEEVAMSTAEVLIKKGIEQGLSKGEYKKAIETAKRMLERGFEIRLISDVTGLSIEEVEKIKNS